MIDEILSIISASPSPLERLEQARDADNLSRLFTEIRQARIEKESSQPQKISLRSDKADDLDDQQARLGKSAAKAQLASSSQNVAIQHFGSDSITLSKQAQQALDVPANQVPPNGTVSELRTETVEIERERGKKRPKQLSKQSEDETEKRGKSSKAAQNEPDSVEVKARQLISGLRSDFESAGPIGKKNDAKAGQIELTDPTLERPTASIRSLRNRELTSPESGTNQQPVSSSPQKLAPLAGLKIEKNDTGQLTITKLPNRVTVGGNQFDLANGPVTIKSDGSIEPPSNAGAVDGLKTNQPTTTAESNSNNGLLSLPVRGGPGIKLAPKNGKIGATASSDGGIEVAGVKVGLAAGTSVLVNSDFRGKIQIDESETRVALGKQSFNLRGGQQVTLGEDPTQSPKLQKSATQTNGAPSQPATKANGFTPLFQR